jgi:hypothetical protein
MEQIPFSYLEFILRKDLPIDDGVIDKIWQYHIIPLVPVRRSLASPVIVSKHSGFRPERHEIEMGRTDLTTTHLFREIPERQDPGYGACDLRVAPLRWVDFIKLLIEKTEYSRIAFYPHMATPFVHCDYRFFGIDRFFYVVDENYQWVRVTKEGLIREVEKRFGLQG